MFQWLTRLFGPPAAYRRLLNRVLGDEAAAERLIQFEIKRAPQLSRKQATERALDRLDYERSR
jgi:hypothetical protein